MLKPELVPAAERKVRMQQLELESRGKVSLTAEEEEDAAKAESLLGKAADQMIEQLDQVKNMRRKMMYAECAKIREAQIEEKALRAKPGKKPGCASRLMGYSRSSPSRASVRCR